MSARVGTCAKCRQPNKLLTPLHGDRGGPEYCLHCGMDWHAEHGRRRKLGRIVLKAMKAFFAAGGRWSAIERLKLAAMGFELLPGDADTIGADANDITSELLESAIRLTHPDRHPRERQDEAKRVTAELLALKPFVFPAPKPRPPIPSNGNVDSGRREVKEPLRQTYPCELCTDEWPMNYCTTCRARFDGDRDAERARRRAKQRARYARRRTRNKLAAPATECGACGAEFVGRRKGAKYCSDACRQRGHRQRVTALKSSHDARSSSRNGDAP